MVVIFSAERILSSGEQYEHFLSHHREQKEGAQRVGNVDKNAQVCAQEMLDECRQIVRRDEGEA